MDGKNWFYFDYYVGSINLPVSLSLFVTVPEVNGSVELYPSSFVEFYSSDGDYLSFDHSLSFLSVHVLYDLYTGSPYHVYEYQIISDFSLALSSVDRISVAVPYFYTFPGRDVGYEAAVISVSDLSVEFLDDFDSSVLKSLSEISSSLENTNSSLVSIENTLTNVTPQMQESINHLETLIQDEQEKIDDVITEMDKINTDFGTQIGDFDDILKDNAGTLEDIGSTTYNSFINDVFGNWFFVSMFALFGAFAFFSRAVFG